MGDECSDLDYNDWSIYRGVINTGSGVNHLKATCNFDALTLEVNGSTLWQVSDPDLRVGEVGLYVCAYDSPGWRFYSIITLFPQHREGKLSYEVSSPSPVTCNLGIYLMIMRSP